MKTRGLAKAIAVISIALFLQACGSREAYLENDELGTLISNIEKENANKNDEGFDDALRGNGQLRTLKVTASAYNSLPGQTDSRPDEAAWGDILKPGMKAIAVSNDLLAMGMTRNTRVKIKGLPGTYRVLDRMHSRWNRKIDIYMGTDRNEAIQWGRRNVEISWYDGN
jgi:3D (Asp-Asp-Asp) domain-containing protein